MASLLTSFTMPNSVTPRINGPIAVVAHDAGAANLILAWLIVWKLPVRAFMQGPARHLWEVAFPDKPLCHSLDEAIDGANTLISGTGWASTLEHDARTNAKARGLRVVAVLDHWVNYRSRFEHASGALWPDEFWVADEFAMCIARATLPALPIRQFENMYLKSQVSRIVAGPGDGSLLYVLEPILERWGRKQPGEFQALNYALSQVDRLHPQGVSHIMLRPHPSERAAKYAHCLDFDPRIRLDQSLDIAQALSNCDVVVGVESFALTVALAAGRPVFSSLPPWAHELRLPHEGIRQIRLLSGARHAEGSV